MTEATLEYFESQDSIGTWLGQAVHTTGMVTDFVTLGDLLNAYNGWAVLRSEKNHNGRSFGAAMKKKAQSIEGLEYTRRGPAGERGYAGLRLINNTGDLA